MTVNDALVVDAVAYGALIRETYSILAQRLPRISIPHMDQHVYVVNTAGHQEDVVPESDRFQYVGRAKTLQADTQRSVAWSH